MIITINELLTEVDYRYGYSRAIWPDGRQLEIKDTDGDLYLQGAQINYLPKELKVGGNLDLIGTQITSLPEGLTVSGMIYLSGTQINLLCVVKFPSKKRVYNILGEWWNWYTRLTQNQLASAIRVQVSSCPPIMQRHNE